MQTRHSLLVLVCASAACLGGEADIAPPAAFTATLAPTTAVTATPTAASVPSAPERAIAEADFDPAASRDPFRPSTERVAPPPDRRQPNTFGDRPLSDLRVVGTVSGGASRAMLIDPSGRSHTVALGEWVGKDAESGGSLIRWKVDRIKDGTVVFRGEQVYGDGAPKTLTLSSQGVQRG